MVSGSAIEGCLLPPWAISLSGGGKWVLRAYGEQVFSQVDVSVVSIYLFVCFLVLIFVYLFHPGSYYIVLDKVTFTILPVPSSAGGNTGLYITSSLEWF